MTNKYVTVVLSPDNINSNSDYFDIYSDWDNYTTPIATNITLNALTARTTPFNMLVPIASTKVLLFDIANNVNTYATIGENNLCDTSSLGFDVYEQETVGRIVAGNLTASTQSQITDYKINWYGPNSTTNLAFTTGKGTRYSYQYPHPLINNSALFASAGYYKPIIDKVWLSDIEILGEKCDFSQTGNTAYSNNPVPALLSCFDDVLVGVSAFTCNNGDSSNLQQYEHRVKFTATGNGVVPQPLSGTFKIDTTTKFFAWKFAGEVIPDQLKLTFIGSAYSEPIVLEYWEIGGNSPNQNLKINPSTNPKKISISTYFQKVTCLTGLTINVGDTIEMSVIPNTGNTTTNWDFYFTCINTDFDCTFCELFPRRIILSGLTLINSNACSQVFNIPFESLSNCNTSNQNKDIFKFFDAYYQDNTYNSFTKPYLFCGYYTTSTSAQNICEPSEPYTIKYEKTIGNFKVTTNNINYVNNWYIEYLNWKNVWANTPNINDPTKLEYFRNYTVNFPSSQGLTECGDGTIPYLYKVHVSSIVTTGQTGSDYWINIPMPVVTYNYTPPTSTCSQGCNEQFYRSLINELNNFSNNILYNITITTNVGSRYSKLFPQLGYFQEIPNPGSSVFFINGRLYIRNFYNETYPMSGSPLTLIPSLSGKTCENFTTNFHNSAGFSPYFYSASNTTFIQRTNAAFRINLIDFDTKHYEFYANTTITGGTTNESPENWVHILTYNNGIKTVLNPAYFI